MPGTDVGSATQESWHNIVWNRLLPILNSRSIHSPLHRVPSTYLPTYHHLSAQRPICWYAYLSTLLLSQKWNAFNASISCETSCENKLIFVSCIPPRMEVERRWTKRRIPPKMKAEELQIHVYSYRGQYRTILMKFLFLLRITFPAKTLPSRQC